MEICVRILIQIQVHVSREKLHIGLEVCKHENKDFKDVDGTEMESWEQDYVCSNSHIDVYFEIERVYGRSSIGVRSSKLGSARC